MRADGIHYTNDEGYFAALDGKVLTDENGGFSGDMDDAKELLSKAKINRQPKGTKMSDETSGETPVSGVRIPTELKKALAHEAKTQDRTFSNLVIHALKLYIAGSRK